MPSERTAADLVRLVRGHIQNYNQAPFRDGFADDPEEYREGSTPILDMLNEAQRQLLATGYAKCDFTMALVAGQREYQVDPWLHQHTSVTYKGIPLKHTSIGELDEETPDWRRHPAGTPQKFYFLSDTMGFYPTPAATDPPDSDGSIEIKADSTVPDLASRTDQPARLPVRFHDLLAIGAALMLSVSDTENEASGRRIGFLVSWWKEGKADLQNVVQQRDLTQDDQIEPLDYHGHYR